MTNNSNKLTSLGVKKDAAFIEVSNGKSITNTSVAIDRENEDVILTVNAKNDPTYVKIHGQHLVSVGRNGLILEHDYLVHGVGTIKTNDSAINSSIKHLGENWISGDFSDTLGLLQLEISHGDPSLQPVNVLIAALDDNLDITTQSITTDKGEISGLTHYYVPNNDNEHALEKIYHKIGSEFYLLFKDFEGISSGLVFFKPVENFALDGVKIQQAYKYVDGEFTLVADRWFKLNDSIDLKYETDVHALQHKLFAEIFSNDTADFTNFSQGFYIFESQNLEGDVHEHGSTESLVYSKVMFDSNLDKTVVVDEIYYKNHVSGHYHELISFDGEKVVFEQHLAGDLYLRLDYNSELNVLESNVEKPHYYKSTNGVYQPINTDGNLIQNLKIQFVNDAGEVEQHTHLGFFKDNKGVSTYYKYDAVNHSVNPLNDTYYFYDAAGDVYKKITEILPDGWQLDSGFHLYEVDGKLGCYKISSDASLAVNSIYSFEALDGQSDLNAHYSLDSSGAYHKIMTDSYGSVNLTLHDSKVGFFSDQDSAGVYKFIALNTEDGSVAVDHSSFYYYNDLNVLTAIVTPPALDLSSTTINKVNGEFGYFSNETWSDSTDKLHKFVKIDVNTGATLVNEDALYYKFNDGNSLASYAKVVDASGQNVSADTLKILDQDVGHYLSVSGDLYKFEKLMNPVANLNSSDDHKLEITFHSDSAKSKEFFYIKNGDYHVLNLDFELPANSIIENQGDGDILVAYMDGYKLDFFGNHSPEKQDNIYFQYIIDPITGSASSKIGENGFYKESDGSFTELKVVFGTADDQWNVETDVMTKVGESHGKLQATTNAFKLGGVFKFHKLDLVTGLLSMHEESWYDATGTEIAALNDFGNDHIVAFAHFDGQGADVITYRDDNGDNVYYAYKLSEDLSVANPVIHQNSGKQMIFFYDESNGSHVYLGSTLPSAWDSSINKLVSSTEFSEKVGLDLAGSDVYVKGYLNSGNLIYTQFFSDNDLVSQLSSEFAMIAHETGAYKAYEIDASGSVISVKFFADLEKTMEVNSWWDADKNLNTLEYDSANDSYNYVRKTDNNVFVKGSVGADGSTTDDLSNYYTSVTTTTLIEGWTENHYKINNTTYAVLDSTGAWQKGTIVSGATATLTLSGDFYIEKEATNLLSGWDANHKLFDGYYSVLGSDGLYYKYNIDSVTKAATIVSNEFYLDGSLANKIANWDPANHFYLGSGEYTEKNSDGTYFKGVIAADGSSLTSNPLVTYLKADASLTLDADTNGLIWTANHKLLSLTEYSFYDSTTNSYQKGSISDVGVMNDVTSAYYAESGTELTGFTSTDKYVSDTEIYRHDSSTNAFMLNNVANDAVSDGKYYLANGTELTGFASQYTLIDDGDGTYSYEFTDSSGALSKGDIGADGSLTITGHYFINNTDSTSAKLLLWDVSTNLLQESTDKYLVKVEGFTDLWKMGSISDGVNSVEPVGTLLPTTDWLWTIGADNSAIPTNKMYETSSTFYVEKISDTVSGTVDLWGLSDVNTDIDGNKSFDNVFSFYHSSNDALANQNIINSAVGSYDKWDADKQIIYKYVDNNAMDKTLYYFDYANNTHNKLFWNGAEYTKTVDTNVNLDFSDEIPEDSTVDSIFSDLFTL